MVYFQTFLKEVDFDGFLNLFPLWANSFLLDWIPFQKGGQRILKDLLPLKVYPANTQRRKNVAATSWRCSDVVTTLLRRCVFAGYQFALRQKEFWA